MTNDSSFATLVLTALYGEADGVVKQAESYIKQEDTSLAEIETAQEKEEALDNEQSPKDREEDSKEDGIDPLAGGNIVQNKTPAVPPVGGETVEKEAETTQHDARTEAALIKKEGEISKTETEQPTVAEESPKQIEETKEELPKQAVLRASEIKPSGEDSTKVIVSPTPDKRPGSRGSRASRRSIQSRVSQDKLKGNTTTTVWIIIFTCQICRSTLPCDDYCIYLYVEAPVAPTPPPIPEPRKSPEESEQMSWIALVTRDNTIYTQ